MLLLAPMIWRRACALSRQAVRMEIPLSLNEVEAEYDFLRASHAVEICRTQKQVTHAKAQAMAVRLAFDKAQAQICYLAPFEEEASVLQQKIIQMRLQQQQLSQEIETQLTQRQQKERFKIKEQKSTIKMLKRQISALKTKLLRLEQQKETWGNNQPEQTLESKGENLSLEGADLFALRQHLKQIAAQIVADIAHNQSKESSLVQMVKEKSDRGDLARLISEKYEAA